MYTVINLLCGIGLFLIGMTLMSEYTTETFGEKLKDILSALTKNKISGVLTGLAVTGIIQSSCATTVTAVSFVSAGILSLSGAAGIVQSLGMIIIGFGLLFIGLNTMSSSFESLKDNPDFLSFISKTNGKIQGVVTGFVMTAIMQSSSATVGILQALAMQKLIPLSTAFYIILGQNTGAVIPVIISSAGASKTAKQVSVIHLLFNLIGTAVFLVLMEFLPLNRLFFFAENDSMKISLFHIMFNVVSTAILLPFSNLLLKISEHLTPSFLFYKREK